MDELKAVSESTIKPDIICIVETWFYSVITDNEVDLPDYQLFQLDHCGCGGGIAIYVRTFLSFKILLQGGPFALEILSLSITCQPFCTFYLCLFTVHYHILFLFLIIFVPLCRF